MSAKLVYQGARIQIGVKPSVKFVFATHRKGNLNAYIACTMTTEEQGRGTS